MTGARQRGGQTEELLDAGHASAMNSLPAAYRGGTPSQARESADRSEGEQRPLVQTGRMGYRLDREDR
jgi:hypothetical protein